MTDPVIRELEACEKRAQELFEDRNRHMQKWQNDRAEIMQIIPGYEYKNRVDDPEWRKALSILIRALIAHAREEAKPVCKMCNDTGEITVYEKDSLTALGTAVCPHLRTPLRPTPPSTAVKDQTTVAEMTDRLGVPLSPATAGTEGRSETPNAVTRKAMAETENGAVVNHASVTEMLADLDAPEERAAAHAPGCGYFPDESPCTCGQAEEERGKDERCWSCEERVEEIAHHWFMDHGEKFYLCNKCWDEWVRVVRGKAEEGSINHIGACKGNWECDCGLHMTEAEIVSRYTRPAPSAALLSAAWDMLHAVEAADAAGELAGNIGGELIDALRAALSSTPSPDAGLLRECRDAIKSCGCTEHGDLVARIERSVVGIPSSEVLDKMDAAGEAGRPMWFAYDDEEHFAFYSSPESARLDAEKRLQAWRDEASEGWSDEVETVRWGRVYQEARETVHILREEWEKTHDIEEESFPGGEDMDGYSDYTLEPATKPAPAIIEDGALREAVVKIIQGGARANDASTTITDRIMALLPASRDEGMQEAFVAGGTFLVDPSLRFAVEDKLIAEAKRRYAKGRDA